MNVAVRRDTQPGRLLRRRSGRLGTPGQISFDSDSYCNTIRNLNAPAMGRVLGPVHPPTGLVGQSTVSGIPLTRIPSRAKQNPGAECPYPLHGGDR